MGCERLGIVGFLWKSVYKYLKLGETKVEKKSLNLRGKEYGEKFCFGSSIWDEG